MNRKAVSGIMLTLLLIGMSTLAFNIQQVKSEPTTWTVDDDGPADFSSIQEAINSPDVKDGDTIFVYNGTYYEHVVVNKTVSLIGEDREITTIDGTRTENVMLVTASNVHISGFRVINGFPRGIWLFNSGNSMISNNTISNSKFGLELTLSSDSIVTGNIVSNNDYHGIYISRSGGTILKNNNMTDNGHNFGVFGVSLSEYILNIDTSNTVDGKTLYYLINQSNIVIDPSTLPDAGCLGVINSTDITVKDLNLTKNSYGVLFAFTANSTIRNVNAWDNHAGIGLYYSSNNIVNNNVLEYNSDGITLWESYGNTVSYNAISQNWDGIYESAAGNNTVVGNVIRNNSHGIYIREQAYGSIFYHNNFIDNSYDDVGWHPSLALNVWDDGYPSGGNYWSDYNGTDFYSGPYQNETGSDGIGDTAYVIDANNTDHYPLMNPWTPAPPTAVATADVVPNTLNLKSKGKWITCYIEVPEGYNVGNIDVSTIMLNDTIPVSLLDVPAPKPVPTEIGDYDNDGIPDLMMKFNRTIVSELILSKNITYGNAALTITGEVDGTRFEGSDSIRVVSPSTEARYRKRFGCSRGFKI